MLTSLHTLPAFSQPLNHCQPFPFLSSTLFFNEKGLTPLLKKLC